MCLYELFHFTHICLGEFEAVNKDEGSILPPALLRCNMTELSVKKKARKEQRFLFIFPGKLAILNEGKVHVYPFETN